MTYIRALIIVALAFSIALIEQHCSASVTERFDELSEDKKVQLIELVDELLQEGGDPIEILHGALEKLIEGKSPLPESQFTEPLAPSVDADDDSYDDSDDEGHGEWHDGGHDEGHDEGNDDQPNKLLALLATPAMTAEAVSGSTTPAINISTEVNHLNPEPIEAIKGNLINETVRVNLTEFNTPFTSQVEQMFENLKHNDGGLMSFNEPSGYKLMSSLEENLQELEHKVEQLNHDLDNHDNLHEQIDELAHHDYDFNEPKMHQLHHPTHHDLPDHHELDHDSDRDDNFDEHHPSHTEPIHEEYEDHYIDTSDPHNPKEVHIKSQVKSQIGPHAESHEHHESKTSTSIGHSPNHFSQSSYSSSHSSSSSGGRSVSGIGQIKYKPHRRTHRKYKHSKSVKNRRSRRGRIPLVPAVPIVQLPPLAMMPFGVSGFPGMPYPGGWPQDPYYRPTKSRRGASGSSFPKGGSAGDFASAYAGYPSAYASAGHLTKRQAKQMRRMAKKAFGRTRSYF